MGFFSKFFGTKEVGNDAAQTARGDDLFSALSLHLAGEADAAATLYRQLGAGQPAAILAPFLSATLLAAGGAVAEAAERLRELSRRCAADNAALSQCVVRELDTLFREELVFDVAAVAGIVVDCGECLKKKGFAAESAVCFEIASVFLPNDPAVLYQLGDTLHDLKNYSYAEKVLKKVLEIAPDHWFALYVYAVLLQDLGRYDEAISYFERAIALNPDHVKCQNNYGAALMQVGRLDEARFHCTLAAQQDPDFLQARLNLGNIHLLKTEYDSAKACFEQVLAVNSRISHGYIGLAAVELQAGGEGARAIALYRKALECPPPFPAVHHALGNLLLETGDVAALEHYAAAAGLYATLPGLHRDFGRACLHFGRREEGLEHLRLAIEQNPEDQAARELLARAQGLN